MDSQEAVQHVETFLELREIHDPKRTGEEIEAAWLRWRQGVGKKLSWSEAAILDYPLSLKKWPTGKHPLDNFYRDISLAMAVATLVARGFSVQRNESKYGGPDESACSLVAQVAILTEKRVYSIYKKSGSQADLAAHARNWVENAARPRTSVSVTMAPGAGEEALSLWDESEEGGSLWDFLGPRP